MKSTYLLPWLKMTTWYFRLSRLLEVSNVKKRTKNHSADPPTLRRDGLMMNLNQAHRHAGIHRRQKGSGAG